MRRVLEQAARLLQAGQAAQAEAVIRDAAGAAPNPAGLFYMWGNLQAELDRIPDAIASFSKAIDLDPGNAGARLARADLLLQQGRNAEALQDVIAANGGDPDLQHDRGLLFLRLQMPDAALDAFGQSLAREPHNADAQVGRAMALAALNRLEEALTALHAALRISPDHFEALLNRASLLSRLKRPAEALACTGRLLGLQPQSAAAWHNRGVALDGLRRPEEALKAYSQACSLDARNAATWCNAAVTLMSLGRHDAALAHFAQALQLEPRNPDIAAKRARALANAGRFPEAAAACEAALAIAPGHVAAQRVAIHARLRSCDWSWRAADQKILSDGLARGRRFADPLDCLAVSDSLAENLAAARLWTAEEFPPAAEAAPGARPQHDRIRVGYLSTDFRQHVVGFLMAGLFERHDRSRFETIGLPLTRGDGGPARTRIEAALERIVPLAEVPDDEAARIIRELDLDILIDLNGHTGDARTGILAQRPAPVQVNYLGYPGSIGAPYIDWIIADRMVIPEPLQAQFSERVLYLPGCYQPNDRSRAAATVPSRRAAGLPDSGFVFCCFNNNYKITPEIFSVWMRLLRQTGNSVLWLLQDNAAAAANLRREAEARGVSASRLVFAPRVPQTEHLARLALAGLFLDTLPYNAHTTASDALWMGVPLVTCPGHTFQSRVAASILTAAGVPELIVPDLVEYEKLALRLAQNPDFLAGLRAELIANRDSCALFDIARFTRGFEAALLEMLRAQPAKIG